MNSLQYEKYFERLEKHSSDKSSVIAQYKNTSPAHFFLNPEIGKHIPKNRTVLTKFSTGLFLRKSTKIVNSNNNDDFDGNKI